MLFADRLEVRNPGRLPPPLTLEKLREAHRSVPGNPLLAESMYLVEYIERMGTGTLDMIRRCVEAGLPEPEFAVADGFVTTIRRAAMLGQASGQAIVPAITPISTRPAAYGGSGRVGGQAGVQEGQARGQVEGQAGGQARGQARGQAALSAKEIAMLQACLDGPVAAEVLMVAAGHSRRTGQFRRGLDRILRDELLDMTFPDKPRSPMQTYRLTESGRAVLASMGNGQGKTPA